MSDEVLQQAAVFSKLNRRTKRWQRIVAGLSAVVVFITTYALILPAITQEQELMCGLEEHTHTEKCYTGENVTCGKQAHAHSDLCYSDRTADLEAAEDWEATIPKDLGENWAENLVTIAKSQLGYQESAKNFGVGSDGVTRGYTRYGAWAKDAYGDWRNAFISFCLHYAGVQTDYFPFSSDSLKTMKALRAAGFLMEDKNYTPVPGDLVLLGNTAPFTRVGIVTEYMPGTDDTIGQVKYIEADVDNRVAPVQCSANNRTILGYATLGSAYQEFVKQEPREKVFSNDTVTVTATYFPAAGIPNDAQLVVKVIDPSDEVYESYYRDAYDTIEWENGQVLVTKIRDFRLYDISFVQNGKEIQPLWDVDVQISHTDADMTEESGVSVVHYKDKKKPSLHKVSEYKRDEKGRLHTKFATDSFSLFAVVTTETEIDYILSYTQLQVTSSTLTALANKKLALVANGYGLTVGSDGKLKVQALNATKNVISGYESMVRWEFTRSGTSGSNYYISTDVNGTTQYLLVDGSTLTLTQEQGTLFTAARSDANLILKSGSNYINIAESGVAMGSSSALTLYQVPAGSYSAEFDCQLGGAGHSGASSVIKYPNGEVFDREADSDGYITLPTPDETVLPGNYPMRLNGWYDIINRVFYDSSMFGQKVKISNNTIFYPEWIAETYDIGQNVSVVETQPDTRDFINTHVYDYTELFNLQSTYFVNADSRKDRKWYLDTESDLGFVFFDWITDGNIGKVQNKDTSVGGITVNQGKGSTGGVSQFPGTVTSGIVTDTLDKDIRMNALFDQGYMPGRHYLGEGDWLYSYDEATGYYYYNSAANAASYNQSEQRFYVYDYTVKVDNNNSSKTDFLPFNYGDVQYAEKNTEINYWFGMMSEIKFYLPFDSGSGNNKAANGIDDMQFRFSGDDDVWVFVDGELALDLGGVHDRVYGEINFSTGKVRVGQANGSEIASNTAASTLDMPGVSSAANAAGVTTYDLPSIVEGGREHTITMCYLERGSSLSNCSVYFNLSPLYKLEIAKSDKENAANLAGAQFQIFADENCSQEADLYYKDEDGTLTKIESSQFTTDENGLATCYGLFSGQTYYIKEVKPPPGYPDLSEYLIEFNLTKPGISKFIVIDSTGEEWEFASGYLHQEGTEHRIELNIYNDHYIGGDKKLYVEKVWGEGSENIPDEITVRLLANGNPTTRKLVLSAANGWKGYFAELPETDAEGNPVVYSVREANGPNGFTVTYEETVGKFTTETVVPGYWSDAATVTKFESGEAFRIITNSKYTVQCNADGTITRGTLLDKTDADFETQLWWTTANGNYFRLQNVAYPKYYLTISSGAVGTSESNTGSNAQIELNGTTTRRLRTRRSSTSSTYYYLRENGGAYDGTSTQRNGTAVTLQQFSWTDEKTIQDIVEIPGWKVINTPWEDRFSIPIEKIWESTVSEEDRKPVSMGLYLVDEGSETEAVLKSVITLSAENGWTGSFDDIPYPENGSYYCIAEHTDEYLITYNAATVSIRSDGTDLEAVRIRIDNEGNVGQVQISNGALILLPNTGGLGVWLPVALGFGLIIMATVLFGILERKKQGKQ